MPGLGKSGTSRINDFKWSIFEEVSRKAQRCKEKLSLNPKRRISPRRLQNYLFNSIDNGPLRSSRKIVLESFNAAGRPFGKCFNPSIRAVAHVADHLMACGCSLRKEPVPDSLDFATYQKLSCYSHHEYTNYLHLNSSPGLPFSNLNVSGSKSANFNVSVIELPLIDPV